ncbi:mitochondrial import receptor protein [Tulasnella sp. 330]|nr:mitochondrial import receptor protein [Tulasnella sp. 330]KAG8874538.1 mitochondrial import receptor protein [Tulasnella sp. 331]KAG8878189.1 mitochondrial import receptor protein [Tulasnella sp. 332]
MVKVEEVSEKDTRPYASSAASASTDSLSSVSSTASSHSPIESESLIDRLSALVDIVPPGTRSNIARAAGWVTRGGKILGNVVWVVTTSALLVGLPLALSLEDEAKIMAQEREMEGQREGQAILANPSFYPQATPATTQGGLVPPGF